MRSNHAHKSSRWLGGCLVMLALAAPSSTLGESKSPSAAEKPAPESQVVQEKGAAVKPSPVKRTVVQAMVLRVVDGDTMTVLIDGKEDRVRLRRLNAPELDEPGGPEARQALRERFRPGARVKLTTYARDVYGRIIAEVELWRPPKPIVPVEAPEKPRLRVTAEDKADAEKRRIVTEKRVRLVNEEFDAAREVMELVTRQAINAIATGSKYENPPWGRDITPRGIMQALVTLRIFHKVEFRQSEGMVSVGPKFSALSSEDKQTVVRLPYAILAGQVHEEQVSLLGLLGVAGREDKPVVIMLTDIRTLKVIGEQGPFGLQMK